MRRLESLLLLVETTAADAAAATHEESLHGLAPGANLLRHLLRREPEVLGDGLVRRGGAEAVDADDQRVVVEVLVPAVGAAGFDGHDAAAVAEDLVLVVNRLTIEDIKRWGGDDAGAD